MESLIDFVERNGAKGFNPRPYYSPEGDSLTFYFDSSESCAARIDSLLTVYLSLDDGRMVGCQVKGLKQTLALLGDFGLFIEDQSVQLSMIFMAYMALASSEDLKGRYRELGKPAYRAGAELEADLFANS